MSGEAIWVRIDGTTAGMFSDIMKMNEKFTPYDHLSCGLKNDINSWHNRNYVAIFKASCRASVLFLEALIWM